MGYHSNTASFILIYFHEPVAENKFSDLPSFTFWSSVGIQTIAQSGTILYFQIRATLFIIIIIIIIIVIIIIIIIIIKGGLTCGRYNVLSDWLSGTIFISGKMATGLAKATCTTHVH